MKLLIVVLLVLIAVFSFVYFAENVAKCADCNDGPCEWNADCNPGCYCWKLKGEYNPGICIAK